MRSPATAGSGSTASALRTLAVAEHARAAELNAVIRAMGEGVVVCEREGRIILANPAAEDIFPDVEETTYEEILGQLEDPDHAAPRLGTRAALSSSELAEAMSAGSRLDMARRPRAGRGPPRRDDRVLRDVTEHASARRSATRSSASCRTSCGRR